jgi:hypothetical protein
MSIYNDPKKYAEETHVTLKQAQIRCNHYKKIEELIHQRKKCPTCGKYTLEYEGGSYEGGIQPFIRCDNDEVLVYDEDSGEEVFTDCKFTSDVTKEYEPLAGYFDFDEILMLSMDVERDGLEAVESMVGQSWFQFVETSNQELLAEELKSAAS